MSNALKVDKIVSSVSETHKFDSEYLFAINTSDVLEGIFLDIPLVATNELKGQFKKTIQQNDILFSEIRPANKHFAKVTIEDTAKYVASTKLMVLRKINDDVDLDYFYYWLTNERFLRTLQSRAENRICSFPQITFELLSEYDVPVPDFSVQQQIARFLSSIDSKIANNNAINAELEAMAKTIYDYWFLQFEFPDENGKPYKSSGGKMVYNEELKREIPEGWEIRTISELLSFEKGKIPMVLSNHQETATQAPYLTIAVANGEDAQYCERQNMPFCNGATIMVMDGAASGDVYIGNVGVLGSTFAMLTSKRSDISDAVIYNILRANQEVYKKANTGSTVPHANRRFIEGMKIALPKRMNLQSQTFDKIQEVICHNKKETQELASLRDFLLPLLMNGQVGFKD